MKNIFSIGDVARIHGISVQALRHYHKIGLIIPKLIDSDNGYRHYTFDQFQYIGRLKYLQSLGLTLDEIKSVLANGDANALQLLLLRIQNEKESELQAIQNTLDDIHWVHDYYSYNQCATFQEKTYIRAFDERYLFTSDYRPSDTIQDMDINLHEQLNSNIFASMSFRRQFGYLIDYDSLIENRFQPFCMSVFLKQPLNDSKRMVVLPAGNYLCYSVKLLSEDFSAEPLKKFMESNEIPKPDTIVALEYEDNLREYYNAFYEIQIRLPECSPV